MRATAIERRAEFLRDLSAVLRRHLAHFRERILPRPKAVRKLRGNLARDVIIPHAAGHSIEDRLRDGPLLVQRGDMAVGSAAEFM